MSSLEQRLQDKQTLETVKSILKREYDLEIFLKRREVEMIRKELEQGERLLSLLRKAILSGDTTSGRSTRSRPRSLYLEHAHNVHNATSQSMSGTTAAASMSDDAANYGGLRRTTRTRITTQKHGRRASGAMTDILYARRSDGVYVAMTCPKCGRADFLNMQGFVNHIRLKHRQEIASHDEAIDTCGIPVDESEVPLDHPCRLRQIDSLPERLKEIVERSAAREKLRRTKPKIKVFEEKIDLDSDSGAEDEETKKSVASESTAPTLAAMDVDEPNAPPTPAATPTPPLKHQDSGHVEETATTTINKTSARLEALTSDMTDDSSASNQTTKDATSRSESLSPLSKNPPLLRTPQDRGSRFYIKRRVTVGNVSQFIPPEKRPPGMEKYSHRWMVYIVGPSHERREVETYIERVRFYIHPSYRPNDVIDVKEPPFQLIRRGWGEFPVRLQVFFFDRRNKPVDIVHLLRLDDTYSGQQVHGAERTFDLDLDRNTQFRELKPLAEPTSGSTNTPMEVNTTPNTSTTLTIKEATPTSLEDEARLQNNLKRKKALSSSTKANMKKPKSISDNVTKTKTTKAETQKAVQVPSDTVEKEIDTTLIDTLLHEAAKTFSLVGPNARQAPYQRARDMEQFNAWTIGRKEVIRLLRASAMHQYMLEQWRSRYPHLSIDCLPSVRHIIRWCRAKEKEASTSNTQPTESETTSSLDHPKTSDDNLATLSKHADTPTSTPSTNHFLYCKFCGVPHLNPSDLKTPWLIDCPSRPARFQTPRSLLDSSTTSESITAELLAAAYRRMAIATGLCDDDETEEEDVDIDIADDLSRDVVMKDDDEMATALERRTSRPSEQYAQPDWSFLATMPSVVNTPTALDWVWRVIGELRMSSILPSTLLPNRKRMTRAMSAREQRIGMATIARAFAVDRTDQDKDHTDSGRLQGIRQQVTVGGIMLLATRAMLRSLLDKAVQQHNVGRRGTSKPLPEVTSTPMKDTKANDTTLESPRNMTTMLTPFHVYKALYGYPEQFDFITNRYLKAKDTISSSSSSISE